MTALLLDGKQLAQTMQAEIAAEVAELCRATRGPSRPGGRARWRQSRQPVSMCATSGGPATRPASPAFCTNCLPHRHSRLARPGRTAQRRSAVSGILVQLPLPPHINEAAVVDAVSPLKDVDGFGPVSLGLLAAGRPRFLACTPHGVQQLLVRNNIAVAGKHVVIVGRSNIVGKPLALMLMQKGQAPMPPSPSAIAAARTSPL